MENVYVYSGKDKFSLKDCITSHKMGKEKKESILSMLHANQFEITQLQDKLYADAKEGVIIILQAMDAGGKDSTIRHVFGPVNPLGIDVISFKSPTSDDLSHDFLWRVNKVIPSRGKIAIFNRSYYEDVLIVDVRDLYKNYALPDRCDFSKDDFFKRRYNHICNYEEYLYESGYQIIKIFLHISKDEQRRRFLSRIDDKSKNWKICAADIDDRKYFDEYMDAYSSVIQATSSKIAPWYIVPGDQKWYARYLVSNIILDCLKKCDPQYPKVDMGTKEVLEVYRSQLIK